MTTCNCPDEVILRLRDTVQRELDNLLAVKKLTATTDAAFGEAPPTVSADIDAAASGIPTFPFVNPLMITDYILCPLFPYTLSELDIDLPSFQKLDINIQLSKVRDLLGAALAKAQKEFYEALAQSPSSALIDAIRKYVNELSRLRVSAVSLANATIITAACRTLCKSEYEEAGTPYKQFEVEVDGFSIVAGVPTTLSGPLKSAVGSFVKAEAKLSAIKKLLG
jgi:hypothetical protein